MTRTIRLEIRDTSDGVAVSLSSAGCRIRYHRLVVLEAERKNMLRNEMRTLYGVLRCGDADQKRRTHEA